MIDGSNNVLISNINHTIPNGPAIPLSAVHGYLDEPVYRFDATAYTNKKTISRGSSNFLLNPTAINDTWAFVKSENNSMSNEELANKIVNIFNE